MNVFIYSECVYWCIAAYVSAASGAGSIPRLKTCQLILLKLTYG